MMLCGLGRTMASAALPARSGAADEDTGDENKHATDHDLKRGLQERCVHVVSADPGNHRQFHCDNGKGQRGGEVKMGDEIGQVWRSPPTAVMAPQTSPRTKVRPVR